jgi:hypothetical protein
MGPLSEQASKIVLPCGVEGLLFQVIDTGPGLGGKDFRRLFDPLEEMGVYRSLDMSITFLVAVQLLVLRFVGGGLCPPSTAVDCIPLRARRHVCESLADWSKVIPAEKIPEIGVVVLNEMSFDSAALARFSSSCEGVPACMACLYRTTRAHTAHPTPAPIIAV